MPSRNDFDRAVDPQGVSNAAADGRRRTVVVVTLVVGTSILAGTLAAPAGSALFYALGVLAALVWIVGAFVSGPIPLRRRGAVPLRAEITVSIALGAILFCGFLAAKLLADHIPVVSGSVASVLATADAGPRIAVLAIALINGFGEEVFFRGSVQTMLAKHAVACTLGIYCLVTIATLNSALVVAALVVGAVFGLERRGSGGVLAPIVTHLTWTTMVIMLLPR